MTAIIVGRLKKENFIVADAMVQTSLNIKSYKECRLQDKISDVDLSEQYLVLAGEEIIAQGANTLNYWSTIKKIKYDLFEKNTFQNVLQLANRIRCIHQKLKHPIIEQVSSHVYIASRNGIKYYEVEFDGNNYIIKNDRLLSEGEVLLNYKGNVKNITIPGKTPDVRQFGIEELEKEHQRRKISGYKIGQNPLKYDFNNIFSSVVLPVDSSSAIDRYYPYENITDTFLSMLADWDLITTKPFVFTMNS